VAEFTPVYGDPAAAARLLAADIARRFRDLDAEETARREARQRGVLRPPGRGTAATAAVRRHLEGMTEALSYLLGCPGETWHAEQFIADHDQEKDT
jgi:hypothetical protein